MLLSAVKDKHDSCASEEGPRDGEGAEVCALGGVWGFGGGSVFGRGCDVAYGGCEDDFDGDCDGVSTGIWGNYRGPVGAGGAGTDDVCRGCGSGVSRGDTGGCELLWEGAAGD